MVYIVFSFFVLLLVEVVYHTSMIVIAIILDAVNQSRMIKWMVCCCVVCAVSTAAQLYSYYSRYFIGLLFIWR